jgi:hypothetical protein
MAQPKFIRVDTTFKSSYPFDSLKHGDAIEVRNINSAREVFRRWRKARRRQAQLVGSLTSPRLLFFIDEQIV